MFQRVLDNLLSNSIKFSPQESQIIVIAEHLPEGGTKIKIADYGQGVPDNLKQCIFEKYEIGTTIISGNLCLNLRKQELVQF